MARDWSKSVGVTQALICLAIAGAALLQGSPALAEEQASLIIRHIPDFSALGLANPAPDPGPGCDSNGASCNGDDLPVDVPDRKGLRRDTKYFIGVQVVTIGVLYLMPESVSSWSDEEKDDYSLSKWWDNVRNPKRDTDDYFINYVLHPYCGAAYFVRARERGYNDRQSFWYSVMLSSAYEFGPEAMFEEPSVQDLIVTPVAGSLLGKYFMSVRKGIETRSEQRGYRTRRERWIWTLTDPLGAVNHRIDHVLGQDVEFRLSPYFYEKNPSITAVSAGQPLLGKHAHAGIRFEILW